MHRQCLNVGETWETRIHGPLLSRRKPREEDLTAEGDHPQRTRPLFPQQPPDSLDRNSPELLMATSRKKAVCSSRGKSDVDTSAFCSRPSSVTGSDDSRAPARWRPTPIGSALASLSSDRKRQVRCPKHGGRFRRAAAAALRLIAATRSSGFGVGWGWDGETADSS